MKKLWSKTRNNKGGKQETKISKGINAQKIDSKIERGAVDFATRFESVMKELANG